MDLAKVIVYTKDEYDLIEDFLNYHGSIFGFSNLIVIDNMSSHPRVLEVYKKYVSLGVTVIHNTHGSMRSMAATNTTVMSRIRQCFPKTKYLIPLDTDEFIALRRRKPFSADSSHNHGGNGDAGGETDGETGGETGRDEVHHPKSHFSLDPLEIQREFLRWEKVTPHLSQIRFAEVYESIFTKTDDGCNGVDGIDSMGGTTRTKVPLDTSVLVSSFHGDSRRCEDAFKYARPFQDTRFFKPQGWDKVFFRRESFLWTAPGNHRGGTSSGGEGTFPDMCLLHFHRTGPWRELERCLMSAVGYGHVNVESVLKGRPPWEVNLGDTAEKDLERIVEECRSFVACGGHIGGHRVEGLLRILCKELFVRKFAGSHSNEERGVVRFPHPGIVESFFQDENMYISGKLEWNVGTQDLYPYPLCFLDTGVLDFATLVVNCGEKRLCPTCLLGHLIFSR